MTIEKSYAASVFEIHSVEGTFPECVKAFRKAGLEWITTRDAFLLKHYSSTEELDFPIMLAEAVVVFPDGTRMTTDGRHSPLLESPQKAFDAHSRNRPFYLSPQQEKSLRKKARPDAIGEFWDVSEAERTGVLSLVRTSNKVVTRPHDYNRSSIALFLFREFTGELQHSYASTSLINLTSLETARAAARKRQKPVAEALWYDNGQVVSGTLLKYAGCDRERCVYAIKRAKPGFEEAIAMAAGQIEKGEPFATKEYTFAPVRRSGIRTVEY